MTTETATTSAASPSPTHRRRGKNPYSQPQLPPVPRMLTVQEAAEVLRVNVDALRARLRRAQVVAADGGVTAPLGPGFLGVKVGSNTWRVRVSV